MIRIETQQRQSKEKKLTPIIKNIRSIQKNRQRHDCRRPSIINQYQSASFRTRFHGKWSKANQSKENKAKQSQERNKVRNTVSQQVCTPWCVGYPYTQRMQQQVVVVGWCWGLSPFVFERRTFFSFILYSFIFFFDSQVDGEQVGWCLSAQFIALVAWYQLVDAIMLTGNIE